MQFRLQNQYNTTYNRLKRLSTSASGRFPYFIQMGMAKRFVLCRMHFSHILFVSKESNCLVNVVMDYQTYRSNRKIYCGKKCLLCESSIYLSYTCYKLWRILMITAHRNWIYIFFTSKTLAACAARYPNAYIVRCSIRKVVLSIKQNIMRFSIFRQESFKTHDDENW